MLSRSGAIVDRPAHHRAALVAIAQPKCSRGANYGTEGGLIVTLARPWARQSILPDGGADSEWLTAGHQDAQLSHDLRRAGSAVMGWQSDYRAENLGTPHTVCPAALDDPRVASRRRSGTTADEEDRAARIW